MWLSKDDNKCRLCLDNFVGYLAARSADKGGRLLEGGRPHHQAGAQQPPGPHQGQNSRRGGDGVAACPEGSDGPWGR